MSFLQPDFFTIECLTNTQVGSGNANYGVIDNLVQRDVTTKLPSINASSLKGAIKEFCTHHAKMNNSLINDDDIKIVFGSSKKDKNDTVTGAYKFLDAQVLAIPIRSDKKPYVQITSPECLKSLEDKLIMFGENKLSKDVRDFYSILNNNEPESKTAYCLDNLLDGAILEDFEFTCTAKQFTLPDTLLAFLPKDIIIVSDYIFKTLTNDLHLPVIARNHLENGESQNLWYEQVVPHKTIFWFSLLKPANAGIASFDNLIVNETSVIQIGANATVGYGYTRLKKINLAI